MDRDRERPRRKQSPPREEPSVDEVDMASLESFPASDAPSWTPVARPGRPSRAGETPEKGEDV